jgi:TRAP-type C4-dicarboxylate transport system permease large subunit
MDAWTIYWILQLDSINGLFTTLLIVACAAEIVFAAFWIVGTLADPDSWYSEQFKQDAIRARQRVPAALKAAIRNATFVMLPLAITSALLPSTKTAAAMVVIPAIVNNETIRKESGELYDLAKQALREAVTDKAKEASK